MAILWLGSSNPELGVYTVLDDQTHEQIKSGAAIRGGVAAFYTEPAAEPWWPRVMTGTVQQMHEWLEGHDVRESDIGNPMPFERGGYALWGHSWCLTPGEAFEMFELARVARECATCS